MEYNYVWEDCINKLDDLDYPIDNLSDAVLPVFPLQNDPVVGPLVIQLMTDVGMICFFVCRFNPWKSLFLKARQ